MAKESFSIEREEFQAWLSDTDKLSAGRKAGAGEVLADRLAHEHEASLAAITMGVGDDRTSPHCDPDGALCGPTASRGDFDAIFAILQQNFRCGDQYTSERSAPQRTLADGR